MDTDFESGKRRAKLPNIQPATLNFELGKGIGGT
jgi:hypothetical protein